MKMTVEQLGALVDIWLRWRECTPHDIVPKPEDIELVPSSEYRKGDYIGIWVGAPTHISGVTKPNPGSLYLGIESDGYTHS